jgi:hypothetical protein
LLESFVLQKRMKIDYASYTPCWSIKEWVKVRKIYKKFTTNQ